MRALALLALGLLACPPGVRTPPELLVVVADGTAQRVEGAADESARTALRGRLQAAFPEASPTYGWKEGAARWPEDLLKTAEEAVALLPRLQRGSLTVQADGGVALGGEVATAEDLQVVQAASALPGTTVTAWVKPAPAWVHVTFARGVARVEGALAAADRTAVAEVLPRYGLTVEAAYAEASPEEAPWLGQFLINLQVLPWYLSGFARGGDGVMDIDGVVPDEAAEAHLRGLGDVFIRGVTVATPLQRAQGLADVLLLPAAFTPAGALTPGAGPAVASLAQALGTTYALAVQAAPEDAVAARKAEALKKALGKAGIPAARVSVVPAAAGARLRGGLELLVTE